MKEPADVPLKRFHAWLADARRSGVAEPTAMALATVDQEGRPEVRMVLLKQADERGFVFYTNLESPKARALRARPQAELAFYWNPPGRQIRISGGVQAITGDEADTYFAARPYLSRLGAWASEQSRPVPDAMALTRRLALYGLRWPTGSVPRPPHWGGFRLVPERMEFWEEKTFRLHDRFVCGRLPGGDWQRTPLYP